MVILYLYFDQFTNATDIMYCISPHKKAIGIYDPRIRGNVQLHASDTERETPPSSVERYITSKAWIGLIFQYADSPTINILA